MSGTYCVRKIEKLPCDCEQCASDAFQAAFDAMPEAQPGQEQRMEREDRIWHVARAISVPEHHTTWDLLTEQQKDLYFMQAEYAIIAMEAARPTADLGEDGELVERLRAYADNWLNVDIPELSQAMIDAADRLILYREALAMARPLIEAHFECVERTEALAAIDALLSRSGDD